MKVGIIGAGAWGTALAITVARNGCDAIIWSYDGEIKHFENVSLPENITVTRDMIDIANTEAWIAVTPAAFFRDTMQKAHEFYNGQPIIICTKGAESDTGAFMSNVLEETIPECKNIAVLSGPQFAHEVACGIPTGSTLAGNEHARRVGVQIFNQLYIQETDDIIGTEICGVGKNAIALICGYNSVAACGENDRALIFTRAWNEIVDMGIKMGADARTFLGLCGIGDLFLSATSETSRNFSGGVAIAHGSEPNGTVEGIFALRGLIERAGHMNVPVPVLTEMKKKLKL